MEYRSSLEKAAKKKDEKKVAVIIEFITALQVRIVLRYTPVLLSVI